MRRYRELLVGLITTFTALPSCLAAGVLVFSPLGPDYTGRGAAAGLAALIFGGAIAALAAKSSFIISSPRSLLAVTQAALAVTLVTQEPFIGNPTLTIGALALCVVLAGVFQVLFAVARIANIIKYTPHTVLAGFVNGVAISLIVSQLKPFIDLKFAQPWPLPFIQRPAELAFVVLLTALVAAIGKWTDRIPAPLAVIGIGIAVFYGVGAVLPTFEIGRTIGALQFAFPPQIPMADLFVSIPPEQWTAVLFKVVPVAMVVAILGTIESLLVFRLAQNLSGVQPPPLRSLLAQGVGNVMAGGVGGLAFSASPAQTRSTYQSGGRTRAIALTISVVTLAMLLLMPSAFGMIPLAVMTALLIQLGYQNFDRWSFRLAAQVFRTGFPVERTTYYNLSIIFTVMAVTVAFSTVAGILVGIGLACVIFVVNMSRPTIRRQYFGNSAFSKRIRSAADRDRLKRTGRARVFLELQGVIFFGNADDLDLCVSQLLETTDAVALDFQRVSEIDVTGANVLKTLAAKMEKSKKHLVFANVPAGQSYVLQSIFKECPTTRLFENVDSAMEWLENEALGSEQLPETANLDLTLEEHDLIQGLSGNEVAQLRTYLAPRDFAAGATLSTEGEPADRMWLLMRGSVSIRLRSSATHPARRIAGLGPGTTVGEMALIRSSTRSADIVADEAVVTFELDVNSFNRIISTHPDLAVKILKNIAKELSSRLQATSDDLRHVPN